jgi:DNA-directed RNA polymerase subunit M/transcription elongation factor TFIIS
LFTHKQKKEKPQSFTKKTKTSTTSIIMPKPTSTPDDDNTVGVTTSNNKRKKKQPNTRKETIRKTRKKKRKDRQKPTNVSVAPENNKKTATVNTVLEISEAAFFAEFDARAASRKRRRVHACEKVVKDSMTQRWCTHCKKKQPSRYRLVQTRSADEGMTPLWTCTICKLQSR